MCDLVGLQHVKTCRQYVSALFNFISMIHRSRSFSKGGLNIDRVMAIEKYKIDPVVLKAMLSHKMNKINSNPQHSQSKTHHVKAAFDKVTGRDKPSPFLISQIKDAHTHLDYDHRDKNEGKSLPLRVETDERLSGMLIQAEKTKAEQESCEYRRAHSCKKYHEHNNETVKTARDLNPRKTMHNLDFRKQTLRPFDQTLRKVVITNEQRLDRAQSTGSLLAHPTEKDSFNKRGKVHAFASYTGRDFLSENRVRGAPEVSGIDWYRVDPEKFKGNWKTVRGVSLNGVKHRISKYDRDCPHWFTTLSYNVRGAQQKGQIAFEKQTFRKENIVKSEYPIRLAI